MSRPADIRLDNRWKIFEHLTANAGLSRSDLSELIGMSKTTVSTIVNQLIAEGIVSEVAQLPAGPKGGRKRMVLEFNRLAYIGIGFEIDQENCKAVVVGLPCTPIKHVQASVTDRSVKGIVDLIVTHATALRSEFTTSRILGFGVAISGIVNSATGVVHFTTHFDWEDVPLKALLQAQLGRPVTVIDRPKAAIMGEKWYGSARDADDVVYMHIGSGIGSALLIGGQLHMGLTNTAGEIGHMTIDPDGPVCRCGNRGCLEALASGQAIATRSVEKLETGRPSILREWVERNNELITAKLIQKAVEASDPLAIETVQDTGEFIGIAVANVVNLLNPELVLIGGPITRFGPTLFDPLQKTVNQRALSLARSAVRILSPKLEADAEQVGAAAIAIQQALEFPNPAVFSPLHSDPAQARVDKWA